MKLVVQRVEKASVSVDTKVVGEIGRGLFVLLGTKVGDNLETADKLAEKLSKLRIMADDAGKMNLSVTDTNSSVLVVSQFTLYADTSAGNRPSFIRAGDPKEEEKIYNRFIEKLKSCSIKVETGIFGEYMIIDAKLDGPVTILLESD